MKVFIILAAIILIVEVFSLIEWLAELQAHIRVLERLIDELKCQLEQR